MTWRWSNSSPQREKIATSSVLVAQSLGPNMNTLELSDEDFMKDVAVDSDDDEIEKVRLTDWAREPTAADLKNDLDSAKQSHDEHVSNVRRWNDLNKVTGSARPPKRKGRSEIQPKLIRRQAEWRYSALSEPFLGSEKLFTVSPVTFEDTESARQNELVLNWQFRTKINRVKFIDDFVRTNVDDGSAIVRVGWKRTTRMVEKMVPKYLMVEPRSAEYIQLFEQAVQYKLENPTGFLTEVTPELQEAVAYMEETQQITEAIPTEPEKVTVEEVIENRPVIDILEPENVYIDPTCGGDIDAAQFVIVSFETSRAELLKEPHRYKNLDEVNWVGASVGVETDHHTRTDDTNNLKDTLRKKVVAYEYWGFWDINGDETLTPIVATWIGGTLIRLEKNPYPDQKLPFVITTYLPVKRELLGEPDAELLEDNQKVLGAVMRGTIDTLGRSANGQVAIQKGALDPLNKRRLESGQDFEVNQNFTAESAVSMQKFPELPQSGLALMTLMNQEAEAITGVKSFSGGLSGEAYGDVAAGIRGALDASAKREMGILRRMAKGACDIGRKIISMNAEFLSEEETIRVTNRQFVQVRREDLAGEFDLEVDISTAEVDNAKAQDLGFMLQTIGNSFDIGFVKLILAEIARLKRMPLLAEQIERFEPQPDPLAEQMKQLQLEELRLKIKKLQADVAAQMATAELRLAQANKTDTDTAEQASGIKHERDIEKQQAQAQGNQNLEIMKSLVKPRKEGESRPDVEAAVGWNELTRNINKAPPASPRVNNTLGNDISQNDPRLSIGSKYFDPSMDPALNPAIKI